MSQERLRCSTQTVVGDKLLNELIRLLPQEKAGLHPLCSAHVDIYPCASVQPASEAHMIGVKMGHKQPRERSAAQLRMGKDTCIEGAG